MAVATSLAVSVSMGVMKPILGKLTTLLGDEYKKLDGVRKELSLLQDELSTMNAFLEKLELLDDLDPLTNDWRSHVREMAYDIEDCIDDYTHHLGSEDTREGFIKKTIHRLKTLRARHRIAIQISELKVQVLQASERHRRYKLDGFIPSDQRMSLCKLNNCSSSTSSSIDPRLSAMYNEASSLVGLDSPKEELISMVMDECRKLKVVSIVGLGGLGKTTLASKVYHKVGEQFHCKAFVSVSQKPDIDRLLNAILSQLRLSPPSHVHEFKDLIDYLRKYLQQKRYLIVVDDLWSVAAWNVIKCFFLENGKQSRVIVTTRHVDVALSCSHDNGGVHHMKPLSDQDSRKLFHSRIFGSEDACPRQFIDVSREILKKCGGLPLAIITVASILACQPTRLKEEWEHIQDCLASQAPTDDPTLADMMHILDLSYKFLPHHLKVCFLHLGTYPEDYEIEKDDLVRKWVVEGFVSGPTRGRAWDVAESYLNELVNRSMVQVIHKHYDVKKPYYKVHDMMLDLILKRCRESNFIRLAHDPGVMEEVQVKVCRLTVYFSNVRTKVITDRWLSNNVIIRRQLSQVRSLSLFGGEFHVLPYLFKLRFLRVLFLDGGSADVDLTCVSQLSQLRYIKVACEPSLFHKGHVVLPSQIQSMRHLETLEIHPDVLSIPPDIIHLPCLSHFIVRGLLPDGIGKLKSLRTLRRFRLPANSCDTVIEALGELTNLEELSLYGLNKDGEYLGCIPMTTTWIDSWRSSLQKLSNLRILRVNSYPFSCCADALSSWISPPFPFLEVLDVAGWTFSRVPTWLGRLDNLHRLQLGVTSDLRRDDDNNIRIIGMLPNLVTLYLRVDAQGIVIGSSTGFKVLQEFFLEIKSTSYLAFEVGAMPNLQEMDLTVDLKEFQGATTPVGLEHLTKLKHIRLSGSPKGYTQTALPQDMSNRFDAFSAMFQVAVKGLPSQPTFRASYVTACRLWDEDRMTEDHMTTGHGKHDKY